MRIKKVLARSKQCAECKKVYRLDFFRTRQKQYKAEHNEICKNCDKGYMWCQGFD